MADWQCSSGAAWSYCGRYTTYVQIYSARYKIHVDLRYVLPVRPRATGSSRSNSCRDWRQHRYIPPLHVLRRRTSSSSGPPELSSHSTGQRAVCPAHACTTHTQYTAMLWHTQPRACMQHMLCYASHRDDGSLYSEVVSQRQQR
jgi:hypothetical protein